jgi:hypothetical protein
MLIQCSRVVVSLPKCIFSPPMASSSFLQELVQAVFEFLLEDIECRWPCVVTAVFFYFDHQVAVLTIVVELFL